MSLCVSVYQNPKELIVAADSRISAKIDGKSYALDDKCPKLYICHGKLIFACGVFGICYSVIQAFKNQNDSSVEMLRNIAKSHVATYLMERNLESAKNLLLCNFLVFYFDQGKGTPTVINIHSEDDFQVRQYDYYLHWCHGARCDEANQFIKENIYVLTLNELLHRVYNKVASEEIGGHIWVYKISRSGITLVDVMKIHDKKEIARAEALAHWSQVLDAPAIPVLPSYIKSTYIDSTNVMSPYITGGVITGALFRTAQTGKRLEIDSSGIICIDEFGEEETLTGICIGIGAYAFSSLDYYHYDEKVASIQYNGLGMMSFGPLGGAKLYISDVNAMGDWNFALANVSGLNVIAKLG